MHMCAIWMNTKPILKKYKNTSKWKQVSQTIVKNKNIMNLVCGRVVNATVFFHICFVCLCIIIQLIMSITTVKLISVHRNLEYITTYQLFLWCPDKISSYSLLKIRKNIFFLASAHKHLAWLSNVTETAVSEILRDT